MSKKQKLSGTELINDGWPVGPVLGAALAAVEALQAEGVDREEALARLNRVRESPFDYQSDPIFDTLAERLIQLEMKQQQRPVVRDKPAPYQVWGDDFEPETLRQMKNAAYLPVSQVGALMPDGHPGYGLPIGGV